MKFIHTKTIRNLFLSGFMLLLVSNSAFAAPVVRQAGGANAAAIQATVDQFRADLGGVLNPNNGQSFTTGRREINWDGVPNNFAEPNNFPPNFFNVNSPRGVVFNAVEDATGSALNQFAVSANTASGFPVRFGNLNASYSNILQTFSPQRLFIARRTHILEVNFFIPGTKIPATVKGFGIVFADVDSATAGNRSLIRVYGADGTQLSAAAAPAFNNGLSFVGISFNNGERIARVVIESGNAAFSSTNNDGENGVDIVAMDDFIYGEPRAIGHHPSDFDGDGASDAAVFSPKNGTWSIMNSGSNTLSQTLFGQAGDIPLDGDFDGDSRNDIAIYRPLLKTWFILRSSTNELQIVQFGKGNDKPVPADYDKDGITDIAVFRPSEGIFSILKSSDGQVKEILLGEKGDIPIRLP